MYDTDISFQLDNVDYLWIGDLFWNSYDIFLFIFLTQC